MKKLQELTFGFADAENYRRRENKDLFNQIFLRTDALTALVEKKTFFLIGEKGTGKTAYAVYLSNSPDATKAYSHKFIRETDYDKFVSLKRLGNLGLSEYVDIWKVILLLLISNSIKEKEEEKTILSSKKNFRNLENAIDEYYSSRFNPEVISGLKIVENASEMVKILARNGLLDGGIESLRGLTEQHDLKGFQSAIAQIQSSFEGEISALSLKRDHTLFIDGIDIRPENIEFSEYLDCVKGLVNAAWSLNNDYFQSIRDSKGRLKIVCLLRPDIYNSVNLQNRNTKLRDNSVVLDWRTSYRSFQNSDLYRVADKFLAVQQDSSPQPSVAWNHYFPFFASSHQEKASKPTSFITVLRYTLHRPRDVFSVLDTLERLYVKSGEAVTHFTDAQVTSTEFRRAYGTYMLGEVKDSLSFYYDEEEFQLFLKFFEYLDGNKKFDYHKYLSAYADFIAFCGESQKMIPEFMRTAEEFLQFLYDHNVLCYIENTEDERFIRWCFLERSTTNISPKVKTHMEYEIHYGLANALNTGKRIRSRRKSATAVVKPNRSGFFEGVVKFFKPTEHYGFIVQEGMPLDIFFHADRVLGVEVKAGDAVRFRLEKDKRDRLMAVDVMAKGAD